MPSVAATVAGVFVLLMVEMQRSVPADACSMPAGWRPLSAEQLIHQASDVLYARVQRTFPDTRWPHVDSFYTAEVDVFCVLKGQRTPAVLNITEVGTYTQLGRSE